VEERDSGWSIGERRDPWPGFLNESAEQSHRRHRLDW